MSTLKVAGCQISDTVGPAVVIKGAVDAEIVDTAISRCGGGIEAVASPANDNGLKARAKNVARDVFAGVAVAALVKAAGLG